MYKRQLEGWRTAGSELSFFSPLADEAPARDADAVYLPGGYPELHAGRIAGNGRFLGGLREAAARDAAIYGECGGYMVLGAGLEDADGVRHQMTGLLDHATSFAKRRLHLGYREARLLGACALGEEGQRLRGHEFHYAALTETGNDAPLAEIADGEGRALGVAGGRRGHVTGSFFHVIAAA